jgi:hypothetical protein
VNAVGSALDELERDQAYRKLLARFGRAKDRVGAAGEPCVLCYQPITPGELHRQSVGEHVHSWCVGVALRNREARL